jgi:hypothetical protein
LRGDIHLASATDTFPPSFLPFPCALELLSAELCLTWRGWTFCPARARPSWIMRGACPLHDLKEVRKWEENRRNIKKKQKKHLRVRRQLRERDETRLPLSLYPPFLSALELLSAEVSLTRRGWTFCPARARPSWIIRGACQLHDLEEVRKREEETSRQDQSGKHLSALPK